MTSQTIAQAVSPLRQQARKIAVEQALSIIAKVHAKLEEHDWDIIAAFPRPNSFHSSREDYMRAMAKHGMASAVTTRDKARTGCSRRPSEPSYVEPCEMMEARFINESVDQAEFTFKAYVAKLEKKVGEYSNAELEENGVWTYSILRVTTDTGVVKWKTQAIVNTSKLGKVFNQFPTRVIK